MSIIILSILLVALSIPQERKGLEKDSSSDYIIIEEGNNTVNFGIYQFRDTGYNLTHLPQNTHLIIETTLYLFYVSADDNTEFWKYIKATGNDAIVDMNPGGSDKRDHKIQALWNDGTHIWGVDCDNDGTADDFDVWKLEIVDDTLTEIGTSAGADVNTVYVYDIFKIGSDVFVLNVEDRATVELAVVWDVGSAPFVEQDTLGGNPGTPITFGVVIGTKAYFISGPVIFCGLIIYDNSIPSLAYSSNLGGHVIVADRNLHSIAYDGNDLLYFISENTGDNKNYLVIYSIGEDSFVVKSEYNVALMLDRNNIGAPPQSPYEFEKAFHITEPNVYQISKGKYHLLKIQQLTSDYTIKAITDKYLINSNKDVYFYENISDEILKMKIEEELYQLSFGSITLRGSSESFLPGLELQVFDRNDILSWIGITLAPSLTAKGSGSTDYVSVIELVGISSHLDAIYRKNYTTVRDSDYILKDIIDSF